MGVKLLSFTLPWRNNTVRRHHKQPFLFSMCIPLRLPRWAAYLLSKTWKTRLNKNSNNVLGLHPLKFSVHCCNWEQNKACKLNQNTGVYYKENKHWTTCMYRIHLQILGAIFPDTLWLLCATSVRQSSHKSSIIGQLWLLLCQSGLMQLECTSKSDLWYRVSAYLNIIWKVNF